MAVVATVVPLGVLIAWLGTEPLVEAVTSVGIGGVAAALAVGVAATGLQAERWRRVSLAIGDRLVPGTAFGRVYAAGFLNSVLPGGLAGDALRAADQGRGVGWRVGASAVAGERLIGTGVVLSGAAAAYVWVRPLLALGLLAGGLVALGLARAALRAVPWRVLLLALALSLVHWMLLIGLVLVAAAGVGLPPSGHAIALATACLAGMSIPGSIGGWGPREAVTIAASMAVGVDAATGFALAAAYGVLATVSTLPGAVLTLRAFLRLRRSRGRAGVEGHQETHGHPGAQQAPRAQRPGLNP